MPFAAMMTGGAGGGYRFAYDLVVNGTIQANWTVPAGVTQVALLAQARGGVAGPNVSGGIAGGGGGAGGALLYVPYTVAAGQVFSVVTFGFPLLWRIRRDGAIIAHVEEGEAGITSGGGGGRGGEAYVVAGLTPYYGVPGNGADGSGDGNDGTVTALGAGSLIGGGAGGPGAAIFPAGQFGGRGGAYTGASKGQFMPNVYGGGGTGLFSGGETRVSSSSSTATTPTFVRVLW